MRFMIFVKSPLKETKPKKSLFIKKRGLFFYYAELLWTEETTSFIKKKKKKDFAFCPLPKGIMFLAVL